MVKVRVTSTVCGRGGVRPHSPSLNSTLTAMESCSGGQAAVTGAQTSCHQSDRRQLSPYIWRPRGLHTSTQPTSLTEFFLQRQRKRARSGFTRRGKWNVPLWWCWCVKAQSSIGGREKSSQFWWVLKYPMTTRLFGKSLSVQMMEVVLF